MQAVAVVVTNNESGDNFDDAAADASEGMIVMIREDFKKNKAKSLLDAKF